MIFKSTRKLSFLFVGASALALAACGGGGETADTTTNDAAANIEQAANDATDAANDAANDAADAANDAADTAADAADDAADAASDAADDAMDAMNDAADDAADAANDAMDAAGDAMNDAADAAQDAADDAQDAVDDAVEEASNTASDGAMDIKTAAGVSADLVSAETVSAYQALTGDPAAGRRVFTKCMSCHVVAEGQNRVGPSLYGIVGRPAGSIEGFRYSNANADSGIVWTEPVMFAYLEKPQEFIRGTTMAFPGLPSAQDRADVIAYIKQESGQ
ncbi:MAG: cytochrome c family protein [Pseudomonadota bacterium]